MDAEEQTQLVKRPRTSIGEPDMVVYANDFQVQWSAWDFKLRFGQMIKADAQGMDIKPLVDVYMTPQHVLAVLVVLARQLKKYEQEVGPLPRAGVAAEQEPESADTAKDA